MLDLAKKFNFEIHYVQVKPNSNLELLTSDTDKFINMLKSEDIYKNLKKLLGNHFELIKCPKNLPMYSDHNKNRVLETLSFFFHSEYKLSVFHKFLVVRTNYQKNFWFSKIVCFQQSFCLIN